MGKKGSNKKPTNIPSGSLSSITLREESSGKRQQTSVNAKSMLKLEHLRNLAVWAGGEASVPSLGAFYGHRLAALGESLGSPPDPSLFPCQRCESILQPGYNCTVRIEKNTSKARQRRKRPSISTQNNVVYKCHSCLHRNLKRGTPRGHMKEICPPKAEPSLKLQPSRPLIQKSVNSEEGAMSNTEVIPMEEIASPAMTTDHPVADNPATPLVRTCTPLLEAKKRKRNRSGSKKVPESESNSAATFDDEKSVSASNKRKRKSWTSLKEIAESSELGNTRNVANVTIPFLI